VSSDGHIVDQPDRADHRGRDQSRFPVRLGDWLERRGIDQDEIIDARKSCVTQHVDGVIDGEDFFWIDNGFASSLKGYANGDFNYDGRIDADDYWLIDSNYNKAQTPMAASVVVAASRSELPARVFADGDDSVGKRLIDDVLT